MSHFAFVAFLVLFVALRWRAQARRAVAPPAHPPVSLGLADDLPVRPTTRPDTAPDTGPDTGPTTREDRIVVPDEGQASRPRARNRRNALNRFYRTVYGPGLCSPR